MPKYSDNTIIQDLHDFCEKANHIPWLLSWFFPRRLMSSVQAYNLGRAFQAGLSVYDTFPKQLGPWLRFQCWLFPSLDEFRQSSFFEHMRRLYDSNLITKQAGKSNYAHNIDNTNFHHYIKHNDRQNLVDILTYLARNTSVLNGNHKQDIIDNIIKHENLKKVLHQVITPMINARFLSGDAAEANFNLVIQHEDPVAMFQAFQYSNDLGLMTGNDSQMNRGALAHMASPQHLKPILLMVIKNPLKLPPQNDIQTMFAAVVLSDKPERLFAPLREASETSLNHYYCLKAIVECKQSDDMVDAFKYFEKAEILNDRLIATYLNFVVHHPKPIDMARALVLLHEAGHLALPYIAPYIKFVAEATDPGEMAQAIDILIKAGLMSQEYVTPYFKDILQAIPSYIRGERVMAQAILLLDKNGILNDDNVRFVAGTCAVSYTKLLVELHKAGLLAEDNAQHHRQLIEKHPHAANMTEAFILRQQYKHRFTDEEFAELMNDEVLLERNDPNFYIKFQSLQKALHSYQEKKTASDFITTLINDSTDRLAIMFKLDKKGQLTGSEGEARFNELMASHSSSRSIQESDNDEETSSDSDTASIFDGEWSRDSRCIFFHRKISLQEAEREHTRSCITIK